MTVTDDRDALLAAIDLADMFEAKGFPKARNGMYPCPNPNHAQTGATPPVNIDGHVWHCHNPTCDASGTAIDLLAYTDRLDVAEAFAELSRRAGTPTSNGSSSRVTDVYPYTDEHGEPLFEVVRLDPKGFRQRHTVNGALV